MAIYNPRKETEYYIEKARVAKSEKDLEYCLKQALTHAEMIKREDDLYAKKQFLILIEQKLRKLNDNEKLIINIE